MEVAIQKKIGIGSFLGKNIQARQYKLLITIIHIVYFIIPISQMNQDKQELKIILITPPDHTKYFMILAHCGKYEAYFYQFYTVTMVDADNYVAIMDTPRKDTFRIPLSAFFERA